MSFSRGSSSSSSSSSSSRNQKKRSPSLHEKRPDLSVTNSTTATQVNVETLDEKRFSINVFSEYNCQGMLVSILEAFEELGLEVVDARVSCSDTFHLQALSKIEGEVDSIDAKVVEGAVLQAISNWRGTT